MLTIAVCDDEKIALDIIAGAVQKVFASYKVETRVDTFSRSGDLWNALQKQAYNLLFLDINIAGLNGIDLGKKISALAGRPDIVFVSSNVGRVFETFEANPFGFVRKDNFLKDISGVIERYVKQKLTAKSSLLRFELRDRGGLVTLDVSLLKYIECLRNEQIFHMDGQEEKSIRSRMQTLEEQLESYGFLRIHKGYLVNCRYIARFDKETVTLKTGETLPVGRSKHAESMDGYLEFIHKNGISIIG